jgi:hypothetical protein
MKRLAILCAVITSLSFSAPGSRAGAQQALWRIDLHGYELGQQFDDIVVKISGRFLVIYLGRGGSRLVFDINTRERVPEEQLIGVSLPPREERGLTKPRQPSPAVNTVARWKDMAVEQVGGVGMRNTGNAEYFLREPGKDRTSLLRLPCDGNPSFVGNEHILFHACNGKMLVVNKKGARVYEMSLSYPYLLPSGEGDRFVVYDREESFFHQFGGTDRVHIMVFRSADGKKLFERQWRPTQNESTNDGRAALSHDGSLVAVARDAEVLVFQVPADR